MKKVIFTLLLVVVSTLDVMAAVKDRTVNFVRPIIEGSTTRYQTEIANYAFRMELLSDNEGLKAESINGGNASQVIAQKDERYAVRLYNPLPVRVAVNLTVDGINSISGKPCGIDDGDKWLIEPYSSILIRGWQVNGAESRRFFFTNKPKSYAKWRSRSFDKDLSVNCGVIGAAFFWNQAELNEYYRQYPVYLQAANRPALLQERCDKLGASSPSTSMASKDIQTSTDMDQSYSEGCKKMKEQKAGTGMGERESHPTTLVDLRTDTGMFRAEDALLIYYDFATPAQPNPFPGLSFAPEMPRVF